MKKILLTSSLFAVMALLLTSCLKDKGFDNQTYGINDPDTQPPGVGFPLGTKTQGFGLNLTSSAQAVNGLVFCKPSVGCCCFFRCKS